MTLKNTVMAVIAQIKKSEVPNNQASPVSVAGIASVNVTVRDEVPTPQLSVGAMCNGMHCRYTIIVVTVINTDAALGSDLLFYSSPNPHFLFTHLFFLFL